MFLANIKNKFKDIFSNNDQTNEENYSSTVITQEEIDYMLKRLDELQNNN
jgi:hypothetical protein